MSSLALIQLHAKFLILIVGSRGAACVAFWWVKQSHSREDFGLEWQLGRNEMLWASGPYAQVLMCLQYGCLTQNGETLLRAPEREHPCREQIPPESGSDWQGDYNAMATKWSSITTSLSSFLSCLLCSRRLSAFLLYAIEMPPPLSLWWMASLVPCVVKLVLFHIERRGIATDLGYIPWKLFLSFVCS